MYYGLNVVYGILIGAGAILPGISSGVLCVALGIYERLIHSIIGFFSDVKGNFIFLFPIGLGTFIGIFLFGNVLKFVYSRYGILVSFFFLGLILGSIPKIIKGSGIKKFKLSYALSFGISFLFGIVMIVVERFHVLSTYFSSSYSSLIFTGFAMSFGVIIPGVSSTVILMLLGKYSTYLNAVSSLNFSILLPIGIGLIIGSFLLLFLIKYLFKFYKSITYTTIIGFMLGSFPVMLPSVTSICTLLLGIFVLFCGFFITIKLSALH